MQSPKIDLHITAGETAAALSITAQHSRFPKSGTNTQDVASTPSGGHASPESNLPQGFPATTKLCNQLQSVKPPVSASPTAPTRAPIARATGRTVSVRRAAAMLGVTRPTLYSREAKGKMPPRVRFGRRNQWHYADIQKMANEKSGTLPKGGI